MKLFDHYRRGYKTDFPIDWNACLSDHPGVTPALLAAESSEVDIDRSIEMLEGLARRGVPFNKPLPMFSRGQYPETILSRAVRDWPHKWQSDVSFPHPRLLEFLMRHGADPWVPLPFELGTQRSINLIPSHEHPCRLCSSSRFRRTLGRAQFGAEQHDGGARPLWRRQAAPEWPDMSRYLRHMRHKQHDKLEHHQKRIRDEVYVPLGEDPYARRQSGPLYRRRDEAQEEYDRICELIEVVEVRL